MPWSPSSRPSEGRHGGTLGALALALGLAGCGDDEPVARSARARVERGAEVLVDVAVELAVTETERRTGLRGRPSLATSAGLVILAPLEGELCLVNDGVPFAIDAVFADDEGVVVGVATLAADDPTPHCRPTTRAALEVAEGVAAMVVASDRLIVEP